MAGHRRAEATPSFRRLCPAITAPWLFRGNIAPLRPFDSHAEKPRASHCIDSAGVSRFRGRAGAANACDPRAADRAAPTGPLHLRRHGKGRPPRRRCARRANHRPGTRAARRQTREIRRRAVPARRYRPRDARTDTRCRQDARDSAARQPRRRPLGKAEITSNQAMISFVIPGRAPWRGPGIHPALNNLSGWPALLDSPAPHSLYAARSAKRGLFRPPPNAKWRGSSAG
jgi:hypothetical protein